MRTTCNRLLLPAILALALLAPAAHAAYEKPTDEPGCWTVRDLGGKRGCEYVICPTNVEKAIVKLCDESDYTVPCVPDDNAKKTNVVSVLHIVIPTNHTFQCHLADSAHAALVSWIGKHHENASLRIVAGRTDGGADDVDGVAERYAVVFDGGGDASGSSGTPSIFDLTGCEETDDENDNFHARFVGCTFQNVVKNDNGGAVYGNRNCSFRACTFRQIKLTDGVGGAIYYPTDANLVGDDSSDYKALTVYGGWYAVQDCTFKDCEAYDGGGAIYTTDSKSNISGCTFASCVVTENDDAHHYGAGGAIMYAEGTVRYCTFKDCHAKKGHGGAAYGCSRIISCLFVDCHVDTADYCGGAICNSPSIDAYIYYCTFINCTDKKGDALYDRGWVYDTYAYNSLFYKCNVGDVSESKGNTRIRDEDGNYFFDVAAGNYHFNRCEEDGSGGYPGDPKLADRDYMPVGEGYMDAPYQGFVFSEKSIAGCYRYYSKEEWIAWIKDLGDPEYKGHDPLTVTTSGYSTGEKDYKISFAEALRYASDSKYDRYTSHPGVITFDLDAGHRVVTISSEEPRPLEAKNVAALAIDGGDLGITLRHGTNSEVAVQFACPLTAKNVTFALKAPSVKLSGAAKVTFSNCVHTAGTEDGTGGMTFDFSGSGGHVAFERCTIRGFAEGGGPTFGGSGHRVTFGACTFTGNETGAGLTWEGAWAADFVNCTAVLGSRDRTFGSAGGATRLFNCILANCTGVAAGVGTDHTAVGTNLEALFSNVEPEPQTIFGVEQIGYRPLHRGTARGGAATSDDGALRASALDVFGRPQEGLRQSQGSYFVDDVEYPSITVTTAADIDDAYDDEISFREAVAYAGQNGTSFKRNSRLTPVFSPDVFPDGKVTLELSRAVAVDNAIFSLYPFELKPAKGQQLTVTAPNSADGALVFATGTKGEISETTFLDCAGGAILGDGELRIQHALFSGCTTPDAGGALCLGANAETLCYDVSFAGCQAGTAGGAVFNQGVFKALNVSLIGNAAPSGSAVASRKAVETLFANAEMVDNRAAAGGVTFYVDGTGAGLVNSIVAGNSGTGVSAERWAPASDEALVPAGNYYAYSLVSGTKGEVFAQAEPAAVTDEYGVTLLCYPLKAGGPADNTGAFLFTDGFLDADGKVTSSGLRALYYSPDPEPVGYIDPQTGNLVRPRTLYGETQGLNGLVLHDIAGAFIDMDEHGMGALPGGTVESPDPGGGGTVLRPYNPTDVDTSDIFRPWPVGEFEGVLLARNGSSGTASVKVTSEARVSGTLVEGGRSWTFSAQSFSSESRVSGEDFDYVVSTQATDGRRTQPIELHLTPFGQEGLPSGAARVTGTFGDSSIEAWHDVWVNDDEKKKFAALAIGVRFSAFVTVPADAGLGEVKWSAKNLPSGLEIDAKTGEISGVPTAAGAKAAVITATSAANSKKKVTFTLDLETVGVDVRPAALPAAAVGTFTGFVQSGGDRFGTFTFAASDKGSLSAKVVDATGTVSFSGKGFAWAKDGKYGVELETRKGAKLALTLDPAAGWDAQQVSGTYRSANGTTLEATAQGDAFSKPWHFTAEGDAATGWKLAFTDDRKAAALTVTLKADGKTSVSGKLGALRVSASGVAGAGLMRQGGIVADFAPVVTVDRRKRVLDIKANLWFDRSNEHQEGIGEVKVR